MHQTGSNISRKYAIAIISTKFVDFVRTNNNKSLIELSLERKLKLIETVLYIVPKYNFEFSNVYVAKI
jgi:hypothetical protein